MATKWTKQKIREWVFSQQWYQRIHVIDDIETPGKVDASKRYKLMNLSSLTDKSVLDVGCNSGQLCFEAKKHGASKVVGIDINLGRLYQARILAEIMNLNIEFKEMEILEIDDLGEFDIVFCISVVTEVPDLISSLLVLKQITKETLYVELAISPIPNISLTFTKYFKFRLNRVYGRCYLRRISKNRWSLIPNMQFIRALLGDKFNIKIQGYSSRYIMLRCDVKK